MLRKNVLWIAGASALALAVAAGTALAANGPMAATTRAQAETHAGEMFARLDANHDGKIDQADRSAHQTAMFDRLDSNHDGAVSRAEFAAAHPSGERGHHAADGGAAPDGLDDDEDGRHGRHMAQMGRGRGMGGGMGMMLLVQADTDHNQAVSQAEFAAAVLAHFDSADANHDGTLTPDERRAARRAMRDHQRDLRNMPPPAGT
jgi:hypothetical protein